MIAVISKVFFPFFMLYLKLSRQNIWVFKSSLRSRSAPNRLLAAFYDRYFSGYGSYVGLESEIESEPCFPHGPSGIFISSSAKIGKDVVIFQHVTIGSNSLLDSSHQGSPKIGDYVYIGAGAKVIGNIVIGNSCRIGANAVVYRDLEPNSVAIQAATRVIPKSGLDNRFVTYRNGKKVYFSGGNWLPLEDDL